MNLTISGHHLEVTQALHDYVYAKLNRVTRHFDKMITINVLMAVNKLEAKDKRQKAEITLRFKGKDFFVAQAHENIYAAIDQMMDNLNDMVVSYKDKLHDSCRRVGNSVSVSD